MKHPEYVRLENKGVAYDDAYEAVVTDGRWYSVVRISGKTLSVACERGPRAVWDLLSNEFSGALKALELRHENIPSVGAAVRLKGDERISRIISVNHSTGMVGLAWLDGRPGTAGDPELVRWSDCEFV